MPIIGTYWEIHGILGWIYHAVSSNVAGKSMVGSSREVSRWDNRSISGRNPSFSDVPS